MYSSLYIKKNPQLWRCLLNIHGYDYAPTSHRSIASVHDTGIYVCLASKWSVVQASMSVRLTSRSVSLASKLSVVQVCPSSIQVCPSGVLPSIVHQSVISLPYLADNNWRCLFLVLGAIRPGLQAKFKSVNTGFCESRLQISTSTCAETINK